MSKRRSYTVLEQLLRQQQSRIKELERQLAESKRQTEAAKRKVREARTEVKKLKSEVIKPQEVKVATQTIKPIAVKELKPITTDEIKSVDLSGLPKDLRARMYAQRIYIPQFIDRLRQCTSLSELQLFEIEMKLRQLGPDAIDEIINFFDLQSMYYGSGQDFIMTEEEIEAGDIYAAIMAYEA